MRRHALIFFMTMLVDGVSPNKGTGNKTNFIVGGMSVHSSQEQKNLKPFGTWYPRRIPFLTLLALPLMNFVAQYTGSV
jgi:hypothetical protein